MAFTKLLWRKSVTCRGHCGFSNSNDDADKDGGPEEYFTVIYLRKIFRIKKEIKIHRFYWSFYYIQDFDRTNKEKKNRDYTTLYIDSGSNKNISAVYIGFVVILNKKNWDMCIFKKVTNEEEKKICK